MTNRRIVKIMLAFALAVVAFVTIIFCGEVSVTSAENVTNETSSIVGSDFTGNGTKSSPYLIQNRTDIFELSSLINSAQNEHYYDKYYKMTADIDMGGVYDEQTSSWSGTSFTPIGTCVDGVDYFFRGVFDGDGYTLTNLNVQGATTYVGLFGLIINGTVKNLGIESGYIEGEQYVGGIVGCLDNGGRVECCYNKAVIKANGSYAGGITGYVGFDSVLGVSVVTNCYNAGTIACQRAIVVGGIVGCNDGEVSYCYNVSMVNASSPRGAVIGRNFWQNTNGNDVKVQNIYYNREVLAQGGTDAATSSVGQSRVTVEDNRLTASKMVTLYGSAFPIGMELSSSFWSFKVPSSSTSLIHYYPQQKVMRSEPMSVEVLPNTYTVSFDLNGATGSVQSQRVREGEYAEEPIVPKRNGYTFVHWSVDCYNREGKFDFANTQIQDDTTLYAIWVFNEPTVQITSSSGLTAVYGKTVVLTAVVTHGASDIAYEWYKRETTNTKVSTAGTLRLTDVMQSGDYYCKVTVTDGANSKSVVSATVRVVIEKAVDPAYAVPKTTPIVYFPGITLADIELPNGYEWTRPSSSLTATSSSGVEYSFVYTPSDTANYKNMYDKAKVFVNKADYEGITHPAVSITYFNGITLNAIKLNDNFLWAKPDTALNATPSALFEALYNKDSTNYNDFSLMVTVTVEMATPVVNPYYNENLYANVNFDLVELRLSDGDTEGTARLVAGQDKKVGMMAWYDWRFFPADTVNYTEATGKIELFVQEISLESIYVSQLPTIMEYKAFESLNTEGMIIKQVFNNGDEEVTTDYDIVYIGNENLSYFLFNAPLGNSLTKSVRIQLITNPEFSTLLGGITVTKAEYTDEEAMHEPVNITYFDAITSADLQAELKDNFTLGIVTGIHAGNGQEFVAYYNADSLNYKDKSVIIVFNIAKAVYEEKTHKDIVAVYSKDLTLGDLTLSRSFYWVEPLTLLNAGTAEFDAYYNADPTNYENKLLKIKVTVNRGSFYLTGIIFEGASFEYDGEAHSIFIQGDLPEGVTVRYVNNGVSRKGKHTVTAEFDLASPENYYPISPMSAVIVISSKKITVDFNPDFDGSFSFVYDDESPIDIEVNPDGVEEGDNVTVRISIQNSEGKVVATGDDCISQIFEPGYYTIYTSIYGNDNYELIGETSRTFVVKYASIETQTIKGELPQAIIVSSGGIDPDAVFRISPVDVSNCVYEINLDIVKKIGDYEVKQVYDLRLENAFDVSQSVDLGGMAQVRIKIPDALIGVEGLKIAYVDDNNNVTDVNAVLDGEYLSFSVSHLSNYAIIAPTDNPVEPIPVAPVEPINPTPIDKPDEVSVWAIIGIIAVIVIACCLVTWVFIYKK